MTNRSPEPRADDSVAAAGALIWRRTAGALEVAMVHRPRYDDWSWPKGKLDPDETWPGAAVREVEEETGLLARLGMPLPRAVYPLPRGPMKEVRYWAAEPVGGDGELLHEVDAVQWVSVADAFGRLTHVRDGLQLQALVDAERRGLLRTWPLLVVRHAESVRRGAWSGPDGDRPLDAAGTARAARIAPLIDAYGVTRVTSSPSLRCRSTVGPFADRRDVAVRTKKGLSEEGFAAEPEKASRHLDKALARAEPVLLCTHRPVLPSMLRRLAEHALPDSAVGATLGDLADAGMDKGEVLVCQLIRSGGEARVVTVERHRP